MSKRGPKNANRYLIYKFDPANQVWQVVGCDYELMANDLAEMNYVWVIHHGPGEAKSTILPPINTAAQLMGALITPPPEQPTQ